MRATTYIFIDENLSIFTPIRSTKKSESNGDLVGKEKTKTSRTLSMQDMQRTLAEKVTTNRGVTFSSVSIMVDAVLRFASNTVSDQVKQQVDAAMENDNIEEIRKLLSSDSTDLQTVLVSALERVSVSISHSPTRI